jgi:hypothetical protein
MSNTHQAATYIAETTQTLSKKFQDWELNSYNRTNDELYELLTECLQFHGELSGDPAKCKALNDHLRTMQINFKETASLATRIVRAVFNSNFQKRAYAYARVITIAAHEKPHDQSLSEFITSRGGIEEIRRTKNDGMPIKQARKLNIELAKKTLSTLAPLAEPFQLTSNSRPLDRGADHNLFVAVMREDPNGSCSMVYQTGAVGAVNAALEQAGKECLKQNEHHRSADHLRQIDLKSDQAIRSAVKHATAA